MEVPRCYQCNAELPQLVAPEALKQLHDDYDGKFTVETFPKDCILCDSCGMGGLPRASLPNVGPWAPGWVGKVTRWLMRLQEKGRKMQAKR